MENEYFFQHVMFIIGCEEGSVKWTAEGYKIQYDAIELGSPYEGIGLLQWSMSRSFDILREIYVALGNNFGGTTPPTDIQNAIENNIKWSSHKWYQHEPDTEWVREFLNLEKSKEIATQRKMEDTQNYIDLLVGQGVTDLRTQMFCADVGNHYGTGWGNNYGMARYVNINDLDTAYNMTPQTYASRRKRVYEYARDTDFSSPPPVLYSVVDIDSEAPQLEPEPITDEPNVIQEVEKKYLQTYMYKSGQYFFNTFLKAQTVLENTLLLQLNFSLKDISWEDLESEGNKVQEERDKEKNDKAEEDINNIPDVTDAIQQVIDKANSYGDHTIPYDMNGARDMVSSGDCSSYVTICFKVVGLDLGGYTGAQYNTCQQLGKVIIEGGRDKIPDIISESRAGDIMLMGKSDPNFGAGGASHVGVLVDHNKMRHQASSYPDGINRIGPFTNDLDYYLNNWVTKYQCFALCRPL